MRKVNFTILRKSSLIIVLKIIVLTLLPLTSFAQFSGGNGTENSPYIITTAGQLAQLATYVNANNTSYNNKHYKLGNDIDLSAYGENFNSGAGWIPIGIYVEYSDVRSFKGVFDGDNKSITNLFINNPSIRIVGLFGSIKGTVKNTSIVEANINASSSYAGMIAGENVEGNILNCNATGIISIYASYTWTGGLVGDHSGTMSNCYSSCSVNTSSNENSYTGGIAGSNSGGIIINCYSTGTVNSYSVKTTYAGGIVGSCWYGGSVSNCYSTGIINSSSSTKNSYAGGIIGDNHECSVSNCYSTGIVNSSSSTSNFLGGIVANFYSGSVTNCAALNPSLNCSNSSKNFGRISGTNGGNKSNNIAYKSMLNPDGNTIWNNKGAANLDGEDITLESIHTDGTLGSRFTNTNGWTTENGKLPGLMGSSVVMPLHLSLIPVITTSVFPDGEVGASYDQIITAVGQQPVTFSLKNGILPDGLQLSEDGLLSGNTTSNGTFSFTVKATNINGFATKDFSIKILHTFNLGDGNENNPYIITIPEQLALLAKYVNAGYTDLNNRHYKLGNDIDLSEYGENFNNGAGWIPIGKYISANDIQSFNGVFDGDNKIISGLFINNTTLNYIGLFSYLKFGTVKNLNVVDVFINSETSTSINAGGITGYNSGSIINCNLAGSISSNSLHATSYLGGIVGYNSSSVSNCNISGVISSNTTIGNSYAGGVVGYNTGNVTNSGLTGSVSSSALAVPPYDSGASYSGGAVGYNTGTITRSYSKGSVTASGYSSYAGGLVGRSQGNVSNCFSTGMIIVVSSENAYAGGIIGLNNSTISNCYSTCFISSSSYTAYAGGIAGSSYGVSLSNCAALNSSLVCIGSNKMYGRITGSIGANQTVLTNNIAFNNMLSPNGNTIWENKGLSNRDGEDIYLPAIYADGSLGERFTSENGWTIENGKLPCFGIPVDMPEHLIPISGPPTITTTYIPYGEVGKEYFLTLTVEGELPIIWSVETGNLPDGLILKDNGIISGTPLIKGFFVFSIKAENYVGNDIKELLIEIISFDGGGTEEYPYIITMPAELAHLAKYVNNGNHAYNNKHYKLGNDIDLSNYGANFNNGDGWIPIGASYNNPFKGIFDGNNHTISGLYINCTNIFEYFGLFGYVKDGIVKNVGVLDIDINRTDTSYNYNFNVGGVVGGNDNGHLLNCYSTGSINFSSYSSSLIGGVLGNNNYGVVFGCYSSCSLNSDTYSSCIGGVVGTNGMGGNVSYCFSSCLINSSSFSSYSYAGGVVGNNSGEVSVCYSKSVVNSFSSSRNTYAGGVVGSSSSPDSNVTNCYSTGYVSAICSFGSSYASAGGIMGHNYHGIISNCAALNPKISSNGYHGRIVGNTEKGEFFDNIAFNNMFNPDGYTIWENIGSTKIDGANITKEEIFMDGTLGGRFTEEEGWSVENGKLPGLFGHTEEIPSHLDLYGPPIILPFVLPDGTINKEYFQIFTADGAIPILWSIDSGSLPIGLELSEDGIISGIPTTAGTFNFIIKATNSNGHDTKELSIYINSFFSGDGSQNNPYIITTPVQLEQLATYVNEGNTTYSNKHYKLGNDIDLSDYGENYNFGRGWVPIGIIGNANYFTGVFDGNNYVITNLHIKNSSIYAAGLFGFLNGTVKNLGVSVNINSIGTVGGVAGTNYSSGNISNCYTTGSVNSLSHSGGIVGNNYGRVSTCYSSCTVNASSNDNTSAGGVAGYNYNGNVSNCYSTGDVSASSSSHTVRAGGIVGWNEYGSVSYCYSINTVTSSSSHYESTSHSGGIVGRNYYGSISNCAALNSRIYSVGVTKRFGRVVGSNDYGTHSNNIAFNNMLNPNGGTAWSNKGASNRDGEDITIYTIHTDGALGGRFTSSRGWTTQNGKLPGLFGQTVEMPEYLRLTGISNNPFAQTLKAYSQNETLYISGLTVGEKWYVIDLSGRIIYEGLATSLQKTQRIAKGVYIIKSGNRTVLVVNE